MKKSTASMFLFVFLLVSVFFILVNFIRTEALDDVQTSVQMAYENGKDIAGEICYNRISRLEDEKDQSEELQKAEREVLENRIKTLENEIDRLKSSKPRFQQIAEEVANKNTYSIPDYICDDFTRDLIYELYKAGYDADSVKGYALWCDPDKDPYECRHIWTKVTVYIESATGEILDPETYNNMYRVGGW
jgi:regulatory protein YycI of two-component signal transduction system YycFG